MPFRMLGHSQQADRMRITTKLPSLELLSFLSETTWAYLRAEERGIRDRKELQASSFRADELNEEALEGSAWESLDGFTARPTPTASSRTPHAGRLPGREPEAPTRV